MPKRGIKLRNEYIEEYGALYADIPKSVFAAVALSFAFIDVEESSFHDAVKHVMYEWRCLYEAGIVPQKPPH